MGSLYNVVLKKCQAIAQITCNPTLSDMDLEYCKVLDELAQTDSFIASRVEACIKELNQAGDIDFDGHFLNAFDAFNEAVTYYDLNQRGVKVNNIPEASSSTPDFKVDFSYKSWDGEQISESVFLEVKSLAFANDNIEYKKAQEAALDSNIRLEEQHNRGKQMCSSTYCVLPLGEEDRNPSFEIDLFNKKICNNIKPSQFKYGDGSDTILYVDMSQFTFPFKKEECLPVYPDILKHFSASGRLWMLAFGRKGERIFSWPEFEGRDNIDKDLQREGILNNYDFIKGIIIASGSEKGKRTLHGFYRYDEAEQKTAIFINQVCDFVNDDKNTNGFEFYVELVEELKKRFSAK